MRLIPAIYIQKGHAVSLYKGSDNEQKKTYPKAPKNYAEWFEAQGAKTLFVIDLDGDQSERLNEIRSHFHGELWWAGQVRSMEMLEDLFQRGADRIVLGHSAEPIYAEALARYGADKLIVGLKIQHTDQGPDLCEQLTGSGFTDVLVKDVNAEGTLFIPSFDLYEKCVYFSDMNVYSSGGVSDLKHLELLRRSGVKGAIISRALFEGDLNLREALAYFPS